MILPTSFASAAKHYLAGVLASAFNGGVSGVGGILGITGAALIIALAFGLAARSI